LHSRMSPTAIGYSGRDQYERCRRSGDQARCPTRADRLPPRREAPVTSLEELATNRGEAEPSLPGLCDQPGGGGPHPGGGCGPGPAGPCLGAPQGPEGRAPLGLAPSPAG